MQPNPMASAFGWSPNNWASFDEFLNFLENRYQFVVVDHFLASSMMILNEGLNLSLDHSRLVLLQVEQLLRSCFALRGHGNHCSATGPSSTHLNTPTNNLADSALGDLLHPLDMILYRKFATLVQEMDRKKSDVHSTKVQATRAQAERVFSTCYDFQHMASLSAGTWSEIILSTSNGTNSMGYLPNSLSSLAGWVMNPDTKPGILRLCKQLWSPLPPNQTIQGFLLGQDLTSLPD